MSRLTIDMTEQQHQALKAMAALSGKSIKQYSLERLLPSDEEQAIAELRNMLQIRLVAAEKTPGRYVSAKDVVEQVIREDEGN
jgi:hypothetical protein